MSQRVVVLGDRHANGLGGPGGRTGQHILEAGRLTEGQRRDIGEAVGPLMPGPDGLGELGAK